ncbi:MAG: hypothetical protein AUK37_02235 [Rhodobacterales bacterium CG2_30_65_12]|nr:MAG: hypothetical protein AUK37_02235 [Rhodobacterales bacterium CG2_30_65_12]
MGWLIIIGAAMSASGLVGLIVSIARVFKAKRTAASDAELKAAVTRALPLNMGAFALSALGLMMVVVGVILG